MRLLVMRFSAMGDVAMTVPVIHSLASQHPEIEVTVLTQKRFVPFFSWMPDNVRIMGVDLADYKGVLGLNHLYSELHHEHFEAVADLHDVLRTKFLRMCFRIGRVPVAIIDKGRHDKHALIGNASVMDALKPMTERYCEVFRHLGIEVNPDAYNKPSFDDSESFECVDKIAGTKDDGDTWIGIAPFAAHPNKIYPLDRMRQVAEALAEKGMKVFLFGAGKYESDTLRAWEKENIISVCGKMGGLRNEMLLMSKLNLMVSMDSANMHIAAMMGTPTLSIWGATHPKAGFKGWKQTDESIVDVDLPCRPCSIYGNKPCKFGDLRCMTSISVDTIVEKIEAGMKRKKDVF
ncbi:MAG: glycosyltransferase family 9 protein [Bacteroidaceae bacterium]|nr:glycosyltransferase family 9 protein [Bacteroidaceae bacterium]